MEKPKYPKIIIVNIAGGHGNFLRYVLDRFSNHTPAITQLPFNELGNSHKDIKYSDYFVFKDSTHNEKFDLQNENIIFIDIEGEALYIERACISRAGDTNTNLYSEEEIANVLRKHGSSFPDYCASKNISLKEGYMYGFQDMSKQGSIVMNKKRLDKIISQNNNVFKFNIKNFFSFDLLKSRILDIGRHFKIEFNLQGLEELYQKFYNMNKILQTQHKVEDSLNGNKSVELDILQQAYVDAITK